MLSQFKPLPLVPLLLAQLRGLSPSLLKAPFSDYWKIAIKTFSRLNNSPTLLMFLHTRIAPSLPPSLIIFVSSEPPLTHPCLSCAEDSGSGCISPGGISPEWQDHLPWPAGCTDFCVPQAMFAFWAVSLNLPRDSFSSASTSKRLVTNAMGALRWWPLPSGSNPFLTHETV